MAITATLVASPFGKPLLLFCVPQRPACVAGFLPVEDLTCLLTTSRGARDIRPTDVEVHGRCLEIADIDDNIRRIWFFDLRNATRESVRGFMS
jgi:hypothetical protein